MDKKEGIKDMRIKRIIDEVKDEMWIEEDNIRRKEKVKIDEGKEERNECIEIVKIDRKKRIGRDKIEDKNLIGRIERNINKKMERGIDEVKEMKENIDGKKNGEKWIEKRKKG